MGAERARFGPYELLSRLGAGGMAETFVAVRRGPGGFEQHVCLKRILPAFEEDAEFVRLFMEEARIAATLRHANIVQVLDFGVVDGSHFMALELVDGVDLRVLLRNLRQHGEDLTTGLVAHVAYELANALEYAHRADDDGRVRGVVHRDISPSNVLLSTAGEVKLADFGIAKAMDRTQITQSGNIKGKVPYMAPEYALSAAYDARSDIFSLGVTLYESLAGARPFDGATELDTMRRVQEGIHTRLDERVPTAPEALAAAIERCIATDREARFANAADFQDALVDVAPPPTARRILGELVRRVRRRAPEPRGTKGAARDTGGERPKRATADAARDVAHADTLAATPSGTMMLDADGPAEDGRVVPASPSAETRTSLGGANSAPADTTLDAAAAEAHRVADAETRALAPADSTPAPAPPMPPRGGERSTGGRVAAALVVCVLLGGGGWALVGTTTAPSTGDASTVGSAPPTRGTAAEAASGPRERPPSPPPRPPAGPDPATPVTPTELPLGVEAPAPEEAPTAPASPTGPSGLVIGVLPYGQVWVDDRPHGSAPARVELRPGPHRVRVTGPNGYAAERRVRVNLGRMREVRFP